MGSVAEEMAADRGAEKEEEEEEEECDPSLSISAMASPTHSFHQAPQSTLGHSSLASIDTGKKGEEEGLSPSSSVEEEEEEEEQQGREAPSTVTRRQTPPQNMRTAYLKPA